MITFQQEYGQQTNLGYSISSVNGYTVSASMGSVNENGKSQTVMVSYSPVMYNVTVKENNLPPGTMWSASLNGTMQSSSSGSITFQVPNGTYSFSVPSIKGYHPSVRNGTVTVKGSSVSETVTFIPDTYTIVVKEKGLPFGEGWTVSVNGTNYTTNGTSISVKEVAGTYNVTISAPSGYTASQSSYNVSLNVSNSTLQVTFSGNSKNTASGLSGTSLYAGIGIGAAVGVIGSFGAVTAVTGQFPWRLRRK